MILLFMCLFGFSEHPMTTFARLRGEARAHYQEKDYAAFLKVTEQLHAMMPGHLPTRSNLVLAYGLNQKPKRVIEVVKDTAQLGFVLGVPHGEEFEAVRKMPEFKEMSKTWYKRHVGKAEVAFSLTDSSFFPEGVAYDSKSGRFFIGSVHQRKVVARHLDGSLQPFIQEAQDGLPAVLGLVADAERRVLWLAAGGVPQARDLPENLQGAGVLYGFHLDTAALVGKYMVPGGKQQVGDVTIDSSGNVYVSGANRNKSGVYIHAQGEQELEEFVISPWFRSPQGMAFSSDERLLYVGDWSYGLLVVDMETREVRPMEARHPFGVTGVDGLMRHENALIAVQNAYAPTRVVRWELSEDGLAVVGEQVLLSAHPAFDEPTLGAVVGDAYYLVANSQWGKYTQKYQPDYSKNLENPQILRLALPTKAPL